MLRQSPPPDVLDFDLGHVRCEASIRINLLTATVCRGSQIAQLAGRELELAYCISLRERPVSRPAIIVNIWPENDEDDTANSFNLCLHRLRKRLGRRDAVGLTPYGYVLGDGVTTDLRELELLQKNLTGRSSFSDDEIEIVTGALRGLGCAVVPTRLQESETGAIFDQKVQYLKRSFATQFARLTLQRDQTCKALDLAQEMIRLDSCDESAWEILIRAHLAQNDRGAALREYRTYARNLDLEFGLAPSRLIKQLIVSHETP